MAELIMWLVLALVLLLGPVILIHELGHFIVGKRAGVRVLEFGLGLPPRLLTLIRERGVLEVAGMQVALPPLLRLPDGLQAGHPVEVLARPDKNGQLRAIRVISLAPPPERREFRRPKPGEKQDTLLPVTETVNIIGDTPEGKLLRGPLTLWEPGTAYTLNLLPMGAFVRMLGEEDPSDPRSLAAQPKRWRIAAIAAGPLANLAAAFLLLVAAYMAGVPTRSFVAIQEVLADTPAQAAGLQSGDIIVAVDGVTIENGSGELRTHIRARPEQEIALTVRRDGVEQVITVTPLRQADGSGYIGIAMQDWTDTSSIVRYSPPRAVTAARDQLIAIFAAIIHLPQAVSQGEVEPAALRPAGLPGILQWLALALKQSVEWGTASPALQLTAIISLAIGITNLLPLPALDGGRILFILLEAIRRRRLNPNTEALIHFIGMIVLLIASAFIIVQDIVNPILPWSLLNR